MLLKNCIALSILLFNSAVICMDATLVTQDEKEFTVPVSLLKLSKTLTDLLEDASAGEGIPLPIITSETLARIITLLPYVRDIKAELKGSRQKKEEIQATVMALTGPQLVAFTHAVNYLDIPLLLSYGIEALKQIDVKQITFTQISQLPPAIRNAILFSQLVRNFGPVAGHPISQFWRHAQPVHSVCALAGDLIASSSHDKILEISNFQGVRTRWFEYSEPVTCICALPPIVAAGVAAANKIVVALGERGRIYILDLQTGTISLSLEGQGSKVLSMCVSPDGKLLFVGCQDRRIYIWNIETSAQIAIFRGHSLGVSALAVSPDGSYLVSGSYDRTIRIWDMATQKFVKMFKGHTATVTSLCVTEDGQHIVSGSTDASLRIWNIHRVNYLYRIPTEKVHSLCLASPSLQDTFFRALGSVKIVAGCEDGVIRVFNLEKGATPLIEFKGHGLQVSSLCILPHTGYIASGSYDKTVRVWDLNGSFLPALTTLQGQQVWDYLQKGEREACARYLQFIMGQPAVLGTVAFPPALPMPVLPTTPAPDEGEPEQKKQKQGE